jgi:RNA polymerase sigma factor (sigma-70 family)
MASPLQQVVCHLRRLAGSPGEEFGDGELLDRFIQHGDERAFECLLQRHGRMVLGVIRSFLHDPHDAEDAFQATFLVLACRARSVRKKDSLRSWLYGVAYRTALKARAAAQRRRRVEQGAVMSRSDVAPPMAGDDERPILAEELHRLPEKYREPLLLCYLEGKTTEQAAEQLRWPQGTVKVRLMRGRDLLRNRLVRRGLSLSLAGLPMALAEVASAAVSPDLAQTTLRAALRCAAQPLAAASGSASVAALTQGVLKDMVNFKLKIAAGVLAAAAALTGSGWIAQQALADKPEQPVRQQPAVAAAPAEKTAHSSKLDLTPESLVKFRELVRPSDKEWRHLKIKWLTDIVAARKKAAQEDKPIVIFRTGGAGYNDPLGVC